MKKDKNPEISRNYKLSHQVLCVTSINFFRQSLIGFVELTVIPQNNDLRKIRLNCKQCRIYKIMVNEHEAIYNYSDPTMEITKSETKQRNLAFFSVNHLAAVTSVDADHGNGEVAIKIPPEVIPLVKEGKSFKVTVEFSLEKPKGGIHFVVPDMDASLADRGAHMFTYGHENSSRLWFPCVDTFSEPCTWKMEFTVDSSMIAVSCGDLVDTVYTPDMKKKTFHYQLSIPTSAPNIGLAVGPFEIYVDPLMHEVTNFCLPRLLPILKHTTEFIHEAFEFYEELLSSRYPFSCYKQVFIDEAYVDAAPYSTLTIVNTSLLHSHHIIDQTFDSRKIMTWAVAVQFFGCFISMYSWSDVWITKGIAMYLTGQYYKKAFGNNEYRYWIQKSLQKVINYEQKYGSIVLDCSASDKESGHYFPTKHLHTTSPLYNEILATKAHLVIRMLEIRLGRELLLQVFNKLLSLAGNAAQQKISSNLWYNMVVSTSSFQKAIFTVTGKDIETFREMWISQGGHAKFHGTFVFNRKRNIVELEIKQPEFLTQGIRKYVGPLMVTIQELDGTFKHTLQIEENITKHDITCHSKSRRNKKKKIPLVTGEEVDMNLESMDQDSPVLWIRIDPEIQLLREVIMKQPDFQWQFQLRYERDVTAQIQAIEYLEGFPTPATRLALTDTIENEHCNIRVRCAATMCLREIANSMRNQWAGPPAMLALFRKFFGCHSCPHIVRQNNFSNFQLYFLQKTIPLAMAGLKTVHKVAPPEVIKFLLELMKYNDNSKNKFADNYYRAALIEALSTTVTPNILLMSEGIKSENLQPEIKQILEEITRFLNLEKLLNSYQNIITVNCLKALRNLQKNGHVPSNFNFFRSYSVYGIFVNVRLAALEMMVDHVKTDAKEEDLHYLLDIVESDPVPLVRYNLLRMLTENPPFTITSPDHPLNTVELVERLWKFINQSCFYDSRIRCAAADFYYVLYGQGRPSCFPSSNSYKEKKSLDNFPSLAELEPPRSRSPNSFVSDSRVTVPSYMGTNDWFDDQDEPMETIVEVEEPADTPEVKIEIMDIDPPKQDKWNDSDVKVKVESLWNNDYQNFPTSMTGLVPSTSSDDSLPHPSSLRILSEDSLSKSLPAIQGEKYGAKTPPPSLHAKLISGPVSQKQPLGFDASMFRRSSPESHDDNHLRTVHKEKKKKKKKNKHKHRHKHKDHDKTTKSSGGSSNSMF